MSSDDGVDASGSFFASVDTKDNIIGEGNDNSSLIKPCSRHPVTSLSSFLPAEILALILQPRWKRCEDREVWKKIVDVLLNCSLVSRAWYEAARAVLYQDIRLSRVNSLRLLLCTETGSLYFTSNMPLPKYPYLRELKVSGQDLYLIAPLLSRLCNLESFEMLQSHNGDDLLEYFSPPHFKLLTLSISQTELSPGLCKWLESSLKSIKCLEVQEIGMSLCHLAKVIGSLVKEVHVKIMVDSIADSDSETISALFAFAGLRRLRIDGSKINKECLLDLRLSLETFTFSEDILSMRTVLVLLCMNWQPSLRLLDVYRMPMSIYFSEQWIATAAEYRDELHSTCVARGIQLNWLPQKNDTGLRSGTQLYRVHIILGLDASVPHALTDIDTVEATTAMSMEKRVPCTR
ncbi:uncharacterized protein F5891DRAFT_979527 [Suillus fuscotomentosus]|uniref:F-box domain-containing protein n=1 Tax=Suillus fuscotomentosus TaxID=1912939 RepID=A0AAD4HN43_9AGAM|nr:uncharacterized protein F5891DRAFT_979527 [Suillus fuscotomentosus]KAG1901349.1 hypothetical protein F5891DRAFT_979527 [Suillus fuscotomentosus]